MADIERIWHFNAARSVERADDVETDIRLNGARAAQHPLQGRPGRVPGTREWSIQSSQPVLIYTVEEDAIDIARVVSTRERA